jgi:hypothetical protein
MIQIAYLHRVRHIFPSMGILQPLGSTGVSAAWESDPEQRVEHSRSNRLISPELMACLPLCHGQCDAHDVGDLQRAAYLVAVPTAL